MNHEFDPTTGGQEGAAAETQTAADQQENTGSEATAEAPASEEDPLPFSEENDHADQSEG